MPPIAPDMKKPQVNPGVYLIDFIEKEEVGGRDEIRTHGTV
jgi:hypothetical protein